MKFARDTWLVFQRQMLLLVRSPVAIAFSLMQPVAFLLLFAPLLRKATSTMGTTTNAEAYQIYVPGLLIVMTIFGGLFSGYGLLAELRAGIIERIRVTPISRLALLLGRALREVASLLMQAALITALALPFGLTVNLGHLLLAYAILGLVGLLATTVSYGLALRVGGEASLGPIVNTVAQPLSLLSGVLLPLALAPAWIQAIAKWNPFAWATDGMRALFAGDIGNNAIWQSVSIIAVLTALSFVWSARLFNRTIR